MSCAEIEPLLAFRPLQVLDDAEACAIEAHLGGCSACRARSERLDAAYRPLGVEVCTDEPAGLWEAIVSEVGAEATSSAGEPATAEPLTVLVRCAFCHGGLSRPEAVYCATCLAPHHGDCFQVHGRCTALGCEETHVVRPEDRRAPARRRAWPRWAAAAAALALGGGLAAYSLNDTPEGSTVDRPRVATGAPSAVEPTPSESAVEPSRPLEHQRVYLLDGEPRWTYRELEPLLEREAGALDVHLRSTRGAGREPLREAGLTRLPSPLRQLLDHDIVVVGDVDDQALPAELEAWVRDGGGLVLVPGAAGVSPALRALSPVEDYPLGDDDVGLSLTRVVDHPAAPSLAAAWGRLLPYLHGVRSGRVRTEVGARVVAEVGGRPLIAVRELGVGRVVYVGADDLRRWQVAAGDLHRSLWLELLGWVSRASASGTKQALRLLASARQQHRELRLDFLEGRDQLWGSSYEGLLELAERALQADGGSPVVHLFMAELLQARGDRPRAVASYGQVKRHDPGGPYAALAQGALEFLDRRVSRAIREYSLAIERDATFVPAYLARARAYLVTCDYPGALRDALRALELDPSSAEALALQAEARYLGSGAGERDGALRDLGRALELDPTNQRALALLAYARLERDAAGACVSGPGDLEASERDADSALRLDPDSCLAYLAKSAIADATGDTALALRLASTAVEKGPSLPEVFLWRGRLRGRLGDFEHCFADLEQVLRRTEDVPGARRVRAYALTQRAGILAMERHDYGAAAVALERSLELDPNQPIAFFFRGYILHMNERDQQLGRAVQAYSRAIAMDPNFADALYHRGAARFDLQDYEDALDDLKRAEDLRQDGSGYFAVRHLYYIRARCHYELADWTQALEWFKAYEQASMPGEDAYQRAKAFVAELEERLAPAADPEADAHEPTDMELVQGSVRQTLDLLEQGERVLVNGRRYEFRGFDGEVVDLSPLTPGGGPALGLIRLPLSEVRTLGRIQRGAGD